MTLFCRAEGPSALQTPCGLYLSPPSLPCVTCHAFPKLGHDQRTQLMRAGPISMNGRCHVTPGQPVRWSSLSHKLLTDWCLSGYLNCRPSSMKVTRVASNVLVEQTMSWEQRRRWAAPGSHTHGQQRTKIATHLTPRCAPSCPVLLRVCVRSTCPCDLRYAIFGAEKCICARVCQCLRWLRMSIFFF